MALTIIAGSFEYYNSRAYWKIIPQNNETYFIESVVTNHYLFHTGHPVNGSQWEESSWIDSPEVVGSNGRTFFRLLKQESIACDDLHRCDERAICNDNLCNCESGFYGDGIICDGELIFSIPNFVHKLPSYKIHA